MVLFLYLSLKSEILPVSIVPCMNIFDPKSTSVNIGRSKKFFSIFGFVVIVQGVDAQRIIRATINQALYNKQSSRCRNVCETLRDMRDQNCKFHLK